MKEKLLDALKLLADKVKPIIQSVENGRAINQADLQAEWEYIYKVIGYVEKIDQALSLNTDQYNSLKYKLYTELHFIRYGK
jgi:hypothetical protein